MSKDRSHLYLFTKESLTKELEDELGQLTIAARESSECRGAGDLNRSSHIKEATIRGEDVRPCPFGLPVPEACENAGGSVARMAPIEDRQDEDLAKANRLVYAYHKECRKCPYAEKILEDYKKVNCDFGDTAAGKGDTAFRGSPLYPQTFHGIGLDGLYGYPLGFYADNNESRNLFFGLFSFLGHQNNVEQLIKIADQCDKNGDEEIAEELDRIIKDISTPGKDTINKMDRLEEMLSELRAKYEEDRTDTGMMWDLIEKWWGPRQVNK